MKGRGGRRQQRGETSCNCRKKRKPERTSRRPLSVGVICPSPLSLFLFSRGVGLSFSLFYLTRRETALVSPAAEHGARRRKPSNRKRFFFFKCRRRTSLSPPPMLLPPRSLPLLLPPRPPPASSPRSSTRPTRPCRPRATRTRGFATRSRGSEPRGLLRSQWPRQHRWRHGSSLRRPPSPATSSAR